MWTPAAFAASTTARTRARDELPVASRVDERQRPDSLGVRHAEYRPIGGDNDVGWSCRRDENAVGERNLRLVLGVVARSKRGSPPGVVRHERLSVWERPHFRSSARRSSSRAISRSSLLVWPMSPVSAPRAASIGSSGAGRITISSPRSSTWSRRVCHRLRTSAGTEIWPPLEIMRYLMIMRVVHETKCSPPQIRSRFAGENRAGLGRREGQYREYWPD
jgi:hypothetical protein